MLSPAKDDIRNGAGMNNLFYEQNKNEFYFEESGAEPKRPLYCPSHLHHAIEIVYMRSGSVLAKVDKTEYRLQEGDLFITFPEQIHGYFKDPDCEDGKHSFALITVSPDFVPHFHRLYKGSLPASALIEKASEDELLSALVRLVGKERPSDNGRYGAATKGLVLALIGRACERLTLQKDTSAEESSLKALVRYCSDNYRDEISLEILEKELGITTFHISRLFHHKLKTSFSDYINQLRASDACSMLSESDEPISHIYRAVGFNSSRSFHRAFFAIYGMTPTEYRQGRKI